MTVNGANTLYICQFSKQPPPPLWSEEVKLVSELGYMQQHSEDFNFHLLRCFPSGFKRFLEKENQN